MKITDEILSLIESRDYYRSKPHKAFDALERVRDALEAALTTPCTCREDVVCGACMSGATDPTTATRDGVQWEYGVRHIASDGWPTERVHTSLEAAREDLETCGMNCHLIRRRAAQGAGSWEAQR